MEVYAILSIIGILTTIVDALGTLRSNRLTNEDTQLLRNLKAEVEKANSVDSRQLQKLNSIVQSLYSMRTQLDPRLINTLDNAINKYNDLVSTTTENISKRQSKYETAAASLPVRNQGLLGLGEMSIGDKLNREKEIEEHHQFIKQGGFGDKSPFAKGEKTRQNNISNWENLVSPQVEKPTDIPSS